MSTTSLRCSYGEEPLSGNWDDVFELARDHHAEVGMCDLPFDPQREIYRHLEDAGMLRLFTVRADDVLVGYAVFVVTTHPHHGVLCATQDLLYLQFAHRGTGREFIRWCDGRLKDEGVVIVRQFVTERHDYSMALMSQGYQKTETVWAKKL